MRKFVMVCIWSSISFFSYTDLRITPRNTSTYQALFDTEMINLPFVISPYDSDEAD